MATQRPPAVRFVSAPPEATFGLADPDSSPRLDAPDVAVFTAGEGGRSKRGRVALRRPAVGRSSEVGAPLPRPPAKDAIRTLTLAFDLLEPTEGAGLARRFGHWRLEAAVAEGAGEDATPLGSWISSYDRQIGVRLRGWGLSKRIRTNLAVVRAKGPGPAREVQWSDAAGTPSAITEALEASYDVVQNRPLWGERAASVTVSARRSSFAAPVSNPNMSFVETDELFAANGEEDPASAVVLAGWRVPSPEQMVNHRVAEEIATANLRLSLFPWLRDEAPGKGWRASIEQSFERVRPWHAGRAGAPENVHAIGASWSAGATRLSVRHAVATDGPEADRVADEVRVSVRPLARVGTQLSAAKIATPSRGDAAGCESVQLQASSSWDVGAGWNVWSATRSTETDCGDDCELEIRAIDAQLSRRLGILVDGRRIPVRIFAGGSAERVANASPGTSATEADRWSVGTGLSVTF